jgi:hypothetical protein
MADWGVAAQTSLAYVVGAWCSFIPRAATRDDNGVSAER